MRKDLKPTGPRLNNSNRPVRRQLGNSLDLSGAKPVKNKPVTSYRADPGSNLATRRPRRRSQVRRGDKLKVEMDRSLGRINGESQSKKSGFYRFIPKFSAKRSFQTFAVLLFIAGAFLGVKLFLAAQSVIVDRGDSALGLQQDIDPSQLKGEGDGRVNVLLIGIPGDKSHPGSLINDVTMVVSIDPVSNTASMLSIPRDMWVNIPDFWASKINAAHAFAEQRETGTGPETVKKTVEQILDIDVHYFVRVDFQGFIEIIDRVGGVTVNVEQPIRDYTIEGEYGGGYGTRFSINAGEQHLTGPVALQYVRSRKGVNSGNDFGRAVRQQQVLKAIKDKVLSLGTFANPIKLSGVIDAVGSRVRTDLSVSDILRMLEIGESIDTGQIRNFVLDPTPDNYLSTYSSIPGSYAPKAGLYDYSAIRAFVKGDLFRDGFLAKEDAKVAILNGTTTAGVATKLSNELTGVGYGVNEVDNAPTQDFETTIIYDNTSGAAPFTKRLLEQRLGVIATSGLPANIVSNSDFVIIVGRDYANKSQ